MTLWLKVLGLLGGLMGASGVGLAAAGAHRSANPIVTTAAYFLLFHAAALVGFCALLQTRRSLLLISAVSLIALGACLFSGDLALRGLAELTLVHMAAPTGGVLMILGWLGAATALPAILKTPPA